MPDNLPEINIPKGKMTAQKTSKDIMKPELQGKWLTERHIAVLGAAVKLAVDPSTTFLNSEGEECVLRDSLKDEMREAIALLNRSAWAAKACYGEMIM